MLILFSTSKPFEIGLKTSSLCTERMHLEERLAKNFNPNKDLSPLPIITIVMGSRTARNGLNICDYFLFTSTIIILRLYSNLERTNLEDVGSMTE